MQAANWKQHSRIGWGIATGFSSMVFAQFAYEFGDSAFNRALLVGCAAGVVALGISVLCNSISPSAELRSDSRDDMAKHKERMRLIVPLIGCSLIALAGIGKVVVNETPLGLLLIGFAILLFYATQFRGKN